MSETNFTEKVLKAFKNIINEIEKGSSEFEVRRTFDELFLRSVLGYERRDIKWEKKRADLTIVDENDFAVVKIETKRPTEDIDKAEHVEQAFKYEEETTKYIGLSNFLRLKLWAIKRTGSELKVDVDFSGIIEQKKSVEQLSSEEKAQILFLSNLAKESLFDTSRYERFDETYARIDITKEAGFQKLLDRLNYIANDLLLGYTLRTFEEYKEGYGKYQAELSRVESEMRNSEEGSELSYGLLKYRQKLEEEYKKYGSFSGFWLWKEYSGKKDIADEEVKEIFCKESIYVLLNKLLFIRIGEDKNLLPKNISNGGIEVLRERTIHEDIVYKQILEWAFTEAHHLYPHLYETGILDWFRTGDGELNQQLNKVLWTLNQFDFAHVDRDILGNLYEKYLPGGERKKLGEFYTPVEVIRYILTAVGYTYSYEIQTKDLLDPACGSGGFLVEATRRLTSKFLMNVFNKASKEELRDPKNWKEIVGRLTPDEAKIILEAIKEHIYGLDVNPFACHIAEMNMLFQVVDLYQKVREADKSYKLGRFKIYQTDSLELPRQKQLVDYTHAGFLEEQEEIDAIKNKKFDFVVGNPPYVRVQLLDEKTKKYLTENYKTPFSNFDIYVVFMERGLRWLKENGKFGYIVSNKFMQSSYGKGIRKFIIDSSTINRIIDFGDSGVFKDVTNYPLICIASKEASEHNLFTFVRVLSAKENILKDIWVNFIKRTYKDDYLEIFQVNQEDLTEDPWTLSDPKVKNLCNKIQDASKDHLVKNFARPHRCLYTGFNEAFVVDEGIIEKEKLEKELIKKVIGGRNISKWRIDWGGKFIIYPYKKTSKGIEPICLDEYPNIKRYLLQFKEKLMNRWFIKKMKKDEKETRWFEYADPRSFEQFENVKILTPDISTHNRFALDFEEIYSLNTSYVIDLDNFSYNPKYLLGLLNSSTSEFFFKQISPFISGGYYRYINQYLEKLPIKLPETEEEKRIAEQIAEKVDKILELNRKLGVDIGELLKGKETEKLPYLASVSFSRRDDAKFERVEVKGDKIFISSEDYIEIKDKKIRDFVVVYFNSVAKKLSKSKDVKGLIYNIEVPKSDDVLNEIVRMDKTKIEEEIRKLEEEINELIFEIYGVTEEEIEIIGEEVGE
jgi:type I restriction-modification system DNA methylase subunit